jgi:hypothetical protein
MSVIASAKALLLGTIQTSIARSLGLLSMKAVGGSR